MSASVVEVSLVCPGQIILRSWRKLHVSRRSKWFWSRVLPSDLLVTIEDDFDCHCD